jgi:hypothetical protein
MIIEFPLIYQAEVILKGRRIPEKVNLVEFVAIEVAEADESEVPVVAEVHHAGELRQGKIITTAFRAYQGQILRAETKDMSSPEDDHEMWLPVSDINDSFRSSINRFLNPVNGAQHYYDYDLLPPPMRMIFSDLSTPDSLDTREYLNDNSELAEASLRDFACSSIITAGRLFRPSMGPFYRAEAQWSWDHVSQTNVMTPLVTAEPDYRCFFIENERWFGAHQKAEAIAWAEAAALAKDFGRKAKKKIAPYKTIGGIELAAGPLHAPAFNGGALLSTASEEVCKLMRERLSGFPTSGLRIFADLEDAVKSGNPAAVAPAADAMSAYISKMRTSAPWSSMIQDALTVTELLRNPSPPQADYAGRAPR